MKRGQLSIFIIVGILLVLLGGMAYYIQSRTTVTDTLPVNKQVTSTDDVAARINGYVLDCLRSALTAPRSNKDPLLWRMAARGGTFGTLRGDARNSAHRQIDSWCVDIKADGCVNQAPTRDSMARELEEVLINDLSESSLPGCLAALVDPTKKFIPGVDITVSAPKIIATINPADVTLRLTYAGKAQLKDATYDFSEFISMVPVPYGRLVQIGLDIINAEARNGSFDKEEWTLKNGWDVLIQKERPYPDVVYNLSTTVTGYDKELILQFARQGRSTKNKEVVVFRSTKGCATSQSGDCRANVAQDGVLAGDTYDASAACSCAPQAKPAMAGCCQAADNSCGLVVSEAECKGKFYPGDLACIEATPSCAELKCKNLLYYYDNYYGGKTHGGSWCTSDTVTGFGTDFVGNRQYVHSCIGGKEYVEPCRDYREETCVEGDDVAKGRHLAACKTNRWYDCSQQKNQDSCQDLSKRDCFWIPSIRDAAGSPNSLNHNFVAHTKLPCVPFTPPGFAFWEPSLQSPSINYKQVCSQIQQNPDPDPGYKWQGFNTLHICSRLGDCGNKRNYVNVLTKSGYKHPLGKPNNKHYNAYTLPSLGSTYGTLADTINHYTLLYSLQRQIFGTENEITLQDALQSYVDPSTQYPSRIKKGMIKCTPWLPPQTSGDCGRCDDDPNRPCSEYRCRALGRCAWSEEQQVCSGSQAPSSGQGPQVRFDMTDFNTKNTALTATVTSVGGVPGYMISTPVPGLFPVKFLITTNTKSVCSASPVPRGTVVDDLLNADISQLTSGQLLVAGAGGFDLPVGSGNYELNHRASFFTPSVKSIPNVLTYFPQLTWYITCEDESGTPSVNEIPFVISLSDVDFSDGGGPKISIAEVATDEDGQRVLRLAMDRPASECNMTVGSSNTAISGCTPTSSDVSYDDWLEPSGNQGSLACVVPAPTEDPTSVRCADTSIPVIIGPDFTVTVQPVPSAP